MMPPITVQHIESDGDGGWFIQWHDAANLDGEPLTGFFHLTTDTCQELVTHQRRPNRASETRLQTCDDILRGTNAPGLIAAAFRLAYEEVIGDRIDRHNFGMKAVTRDGHADLEAVRQGAPVRPWNAADPRPETFRRFMKGRNR